jgi:N6-L-threonylcarbamoyladenine synthase
MVAKQDLAEKSDLELVKLTLIDQENFLYLVNRYEKKLLRFIQRISGLGLDDAQDLLQEVFIKVYQNLNDLAATFQNAVFETLLRKYKLAIEKYQPKLLLASGGVLANLELRKRLRKLAKEFGLPIFMPSHKNLNTDNAAMVGVVAYQKALRKEFVEEIESLDRDPRLQFN